MVTQETPFTLLGVEGRITRLPWPSSPLFMHQVFKASRPFKTKGYREGSNITIEVRFDDNCKNGHMTFAVTGSVWEPGLGDTTGGAIHGEVAKAFPELAHLNKWHLVSTDGPMHGVANALYHAGDLDHQGKRKGEAWAWDTHIQFFGFPISFKIKDSFKVFLEEAIKSRQILELVSIEHKKADYPYAPRYTFKGYGKEWHDCPFDTKTEAEQWLAAMSMDTPPEFIRLPTLFSEGKERNLEAARNCAVWPEATDEQLMLPKEELKALLEARLPMLLEAFKADMTACGFEWRTA